MDFDGGYDRSRRGGRVKDLHDFPPRSRLPQESGDWIPNSYWGAGYTPTPGRSTAEDYRICQPEVAVPCDRIHALYGRSRGMVRWAAKPSWAPTVAVTDG